MLVDAMAPTNFLATNPAALKRAFETGGVSLMRGMRNFMTDLTTNGGLPRKVDRSAFTSGRTSPPPRARSCSATTSWS